MSNAITVTLTLTDKTCADILCTALEGGIGYWCKAGDILRTGTPEDRDRSGFDWEYISFKAYDTEEYDDADNDSERDAAFLGIVNYETVRLGVQRILDASVRIRADLFQQVLRNVTQDDPMDSDAADCVVQAGLLNELRFS